MLVACGLNHNTAPLSIREKLSIDHEQLPASLSQLIKVPGVSEAVILSTCNRTEIYCEARCNAEILVEWLKSHYIIPAANLNDYFYYHLQEKTIRHAIRVASGLDSMVLGEPQIFGQMKAAVTIADTAGVLGKQLRKLFQHVFTVAKKIRSTTDIGVNPVSLGYVVVHLAKRIFSDLSQCRVLLVGAGQIIQLITQHLYGNNVRHICIANRTFANAHRVAETVDAEIIRLDEIADYLPKADIVITATNTSFSVIGKGLVERSLKLRKHRPILMIDLAVPRNIEPEVQQLEDVYLYCIDSLQALLEENRNKRVDAIHIAEAIIESQTSHFIAEIRASQANHTIKVYRHKVKQLCHHALTKAYQDLALGDEPREVLEKFADRLANKIMHDPCVNLRTAVYDGDLDLIHTAKKLFSLEQ
jgi:glutamyl-tRNA reductase